MSEKLNKFVEKTIFSAFLFAQVYIASGATSLLGYIALAITLFTSCDHLIKKITQPDQASYIETIGHILAIFCKGAILKYNLSSIISSMLSTHFFFPTVLAQFIAIAATCQILMQRDMVSKLLFSFGIDLKNDRKIAHFFETVFIGATCLFAALYMGIPITQAAALFALRDTIRDAFIHHARELIQSISEEKNVLFAILGFISTMTNTHLMSHEKTTKDTFITDILILYTPAAAIAALYAPSLATLQTSTYLVGAAATMRTGGSLWRHGINKKTFSEIGMADDNGLKNK